MLIILIALGTLEEPTRELATYLGPGSELTWLMGKKTITLSAVSNEIGNIEASRGAWNKIQ